MNKVVFAKLPSKPLAKMALPRVLQGAKPAVRWKSEGVVPNLFGAPVSASPILDKPLLSMNNPQVFPDIVCLAQHSWSAAWARPQQLMSRLARKHRVFYVRPISVGHMLRSSHERQKPVVKLSENLYLITLYMPGGAPKNDAQQKNNELNITFALKKLFAQMNIENPWLWFYAPISEYLLDHLAHSKVIYDCTDAWAAFEQASPLLKKREQALSAKADLLLTGTSQLYDHKTQEFASKCHYVPCGIEAGHFDQAAQKQDLPEDLRNLKRPLIGYLGLIDEPRMDLALIGKMAEKFPACSFVYAGPLQDVPASVFAPSNVHYLGHKSYEHVPAYMQALDIAIIPFKQTEATRYIHPTKILEYMVCEKPILSIALPDLERHYAQRVALAKNAEDFLCKLTELVQGRIKLPVKDNAQWASKQSWDNVLTRIESLCHDAVPL